MTDIQDGNALTTVEKYYKEYGVRAKELKAAGKKVLGYLSALCPIEIIAAAGIIPFRLKGNVSEAITKGDAYMETIVCPFVRNVFDASCRSWHAGIIHQAQTLKKVYKDIPVFIMEGDIVDISSYNEADTHNRIDAFIETLENYKNRG